MFYFNAPLSKIGKEWKAKEETAIRIEHCSRILLPLTFALFALVFSTVVLKYRLSEDQVEEEWKEMVSATK